MVQAKFKFESYEELEFNRWMERLIEYGSRLLVEVNFSDTDSSGDEVECSNGFSKSGTSDPVQVVNFSVAYSRCSVE